jgi:hypothetical protein
MSNYGGEASCARSGKDQLMAGKKKKKQIPAGRLGARQNTKLEKISMQLGCKFGWD